MKIQIEDASALPEVLRDAVTEVEGGHELDLSKLAPVSEVEKFKAKHLTASQEAIERREALKKWKALGETPEAVQEALSNAGKAGDSEQIIAQMKDAHATEVGELRGQISTMQKDRTSADLRSELAKAGLLPESLEFAASALQARIKITDDGMRITTADGTTPMVGSGADGGATLADLAKEFASVMPQLVAAGGKPGGGKQPGGNGGKPEKKWSDMTGTEKVKLHRENPQEYERLKAAG